MSRTLSAQERDLRTLLRAAQSLQDRVAVLPYLYPQARGNEDYQALLDALAVLHSALTTFARTMRRTEEEEEGNT